MVDLRRYKGKKSGPNWLKLWLKTLATDELATQSVKPVWLHTFCHCPGVTNHPPLSPSYFNASSGDLYTVRDSWMRMQPYGRLNLLKFWYICIYDCQSDKVIKKLPLRKTNKWTKYDSPTCLQMWLFYWNHPQNYIKDEHKKWTFKHVMIILLVPQMNGLNKSS